MAIGPFIRQMFGPFERPISNSYRSFFVDLTAFVNQIQQWASASTILELGCGEGALAEILVQKYPHTYITGIDISPKVGRLYQGDLSRVTFKQQTIGEFAAENSTGYDLVLVCDVLHHISWESHKDILRDAAKVLKPGGYLILKDWERMGNPIYYVAYFMERYVTGDRVRYKSADEFRMLIQEVFGTNCIKAEARIRPWKNNIAFLVQV